jgi:RNA ligase
MQYDIEILNSYIERGLIEKNSHPTLPIDIYNYSRECQYSGSWDEITLNMRGTILDRNGLVIAKPFPKFFNMEEMKNIPSEPFDVFEKMDGSLGILFYYNNEWHLATKGSFTSDQAIRGRKILEKYRYHTLLNNCTYLFEIIYPENKIVCHYDYEDLILLAIIDNYDGYEINLHSEEAHLSGIRITDIMENMGFKVVKKYKGIEDYKELKKMIVGNQEGFVIKFKSGTRMKIKGEEYVRLHKLMTEFSNVSIWESLKCGDDLKDLLERVPDEFDLWVKKKKNEILAKYSETESEALNLFDSHVKNIETDKDAAFFIKDNVDQKLHPILFKMRKDKDYSDLIWKLIRPKYEKPFWNKE